jgi:hypothetical protein
MLLCRRIYYSFLIVLFGCVHFQPFRSWWSSLSELHTLCGRQISARCCLSEAAAVDLSESNYRQAANSLQISYGIGKIRSHVQNSTNRVSPPVVLTVPVMMSYQTFADEFKNTERSGIHAPGNELPVIEGSGHHCVGFQVQCSEATALLSQI